MEAALPTLSVCPDISSLQSSFSCKTLDSSSSAGFDLSNIIEFYQDDCFKLAMKLIQNYTLMGIKTNNDSGSSGILINAGAPESFKDIFKIPEPT